MLAVPKHNSILEANHSGWQVYTLSAATVVGCARGSRDTPMAGKQDPAERAHQSSAQHGEPPRDSPPAHQSLDGMSQNPLGRACSGIFLNTFTETCCVNDFR